MGVLLVLGNTLNFKRKFLLCIYVEESHFENYSEVPSV